MAPAHPAILAAIARANDGYERSYGGDAATVRVEHRFAEIFERDVRVFLVGTGGAANGLAISQLTPPWGMVIAHEASHIQVDECGGAEFFSHGAKVLPVAGDAGKLSPDSLRHALGGFDAQSVHAPQAKAVSIAQATECGTVYTPAELQALCAFARARGLSVHMDGARFANAVAALSCAPADISWRASVDALSFGATKNGCLIAEAVVFFDPARAENFAYRRKRAGQLFSKSRYLAAQFEAYFEDGLWLRLARGANAMATRLSTGLGAISHVRLEYPQQANEVFVALPAGMAERLRAAGAEFLSWVMPGDPAEGRLIRLVCSWATSAEEIDQFVELVRRG
jgi:threonine aldolase